MPLNPNNFIIVLKVSIFICLLWVGHGKIFAYSVVLVFMHVFANYLPCEKAVSNSLVMPFLIKCLQMHEFLHQKLVSSFYIRESGIREDISEIL